jgi:hypothetical protein
LHSVQAGGIPCISIVVFKCHTELIIILRLETAKSEFNEKEREMSLYHGRREDNGHHCGIQETEELLYKIETSGTTAFHA